MGYRSSVVIAIHKSIVAQDLIEPFIPDCLKQELFSDEDEHARYWELNDWKWYDSYKDIQEIEAMFEKLENMDMLKIPTQNGTYYSRAVFGAMRIGEEDGDTQSWGEPADYDIYVSRYLNYPGSH